MYARDSRKCAASNVRKITGINEPSSVSSATGRTWQPRWSPARCPPMPRRHGGTARNGFLALVLGQPRSIPWFILDTFGQLVHFGASNPALRPPKCWCSGQGVTDLADHVRPSPALIPPDRFRSVAASTPARSRYGQRRSRHCRPHCFTRLRARRGGRDLGIANREGPGRRLRSSLRSARQPPAQGARRTNGAIRSFGVRLGLGGGLRFFQAPHFGRSDPTWPTNVALWHFSKVVRLTDDVRSRGKSRSLC